VGWDAQGQEHEGGSPYEMQCRAEADSGLRWMGWRLREEGLATVSEELGPPVSSGGVELWSLLESCVHLRCWGKAERPARQEAPGR
jgi:hypothetical protein